MPTTRIAPNCRWAEPTLFLQFPLWMAAEDYPWSCSRDGDHRMLATTTTCHTCRRWDARDSDDSRDSGSSAAR
jgi:hypothetical protein